jgi:hypothetical protein
VDIYNLIIMSQQQNIYSIQLLNDLHNYFPDLLYNFERFNNVQDILRYIREVANISPFQRGLHQYNSRDTINTRNTRNNTIRPISVSTIPIPVNTTNDSDLINHLFTSLFTNEIVNVSNTNTNTMTDTAINDLMTGLLTGLIPLSNRRNLNSFLEQRVIIRPTEDEIRRASISYRTNTNLDEICAICQDDIELNQEIRKLTHCNHYFHKNCIDTWFISNVHCPTCRHDIRDVGQNNPPTVPENYRTETI